MSNEIQTNMENPGYQENVQEQIDILVQKELLQIERVNTSKQENERKQPVTGRDTDNLANSPRPKVKVPDHRDVVAKWMNEAVTFGLNLVEPSSPTAPSHLFTLAASLMDLFLLKCKIKLTQLQLLGSACLSIAAKSRKILLSEDALVVCSDYTITHEEIQVCLDIFLNMCLKICVQCTVEF